MINQQDFAEIRRDFYLGQDQFDLNLPQHLIEDFGNWLRDSAISFDVYNGNNAGFINNQYVLDNCYGNSQNEARINGRNYCEGFAKIQGRYILHGFNYEDIYAIDVKAINNPDAFVDANGHPPNNYFGVPIGMDAKKP